MGRYLLQESEEHLWWVLTDKELGIVLKFKEGEYNDSQKVTVLNDIDTEHLAVAAREMAEWMAENHYELIFSSPRLIKQHNRLMVGKDIKMLRKQAGLTTRELAKLTGLPQSHISRIEAGKYNVSLDTLSLIANALYAEVTFRLYDDDED